MSRDLTPPGPVYALADADALAPIPVPEAVVTLAGEGVSWIQVRAKALSGGELCRTVEDTLELLDRKGLDHVRLWIDDRVDVAALFPVAGVHVGQTDLPAPAARRVLGNRAWIGVSTHSEEQLDVAADDPSVDVVAVGPVFATTGKENPDPVVGLDLVRRARRRLAGTGKTLVAIGGIDAERLPAVLDAGADAAAVLGAVCRGDVAANARRLVTAGASP